MKTECEHKLFPYILGVASNDLHMECEYCGKRFELKECTCDCHKYHNTVLHDGLDNCVCKGTGWVKEGR